jgi:hypothetical protein
MPNNYSGNASFAYNGKDYDFEILNGFGQARIPVYMGSHHFKLTVYPGAVNECSFEIDYQILPLIFIPHIQGSRDDFIIVEAGYGCNGRVAFYVNGKYVRDYTFVNGIATISMYSYAIDAYNVKVIVSGGDLVYKYEQKTYVKKNQLKLASSLNLLYQGGQTYQVKLLDINKRLFPNQIVSFYVNGKLFKKVKTNSKGIAAVTLTQLPGKYRVVAKFDDIQLSNIVNVKQIITLNQAVVKKSAKNLVLQASLAKVNGKYLKNKMITFKFNGKKYSAKTNAKGIAKVTINSNVLKKLKVGQKVIYTATYVKTTLKKATSVVK